MNINIYKSPQMCLYYESNTNSCWIPAGILPESMESDHSCRIPGLLLDSAGILPEFPDSCQIPQIPAGISGGKVTIWGMITAHGVGDIVRIEGNLNKELYYEILQDDVLGTFHDLHLDF